MGRSLPWGLPCSSLWPCSGEGWTAHRRNGTPSSCRRHSLGLRAVIPAAVLRPGRRVSVGAVGRVFLRSMFLQAAWNPRGMQNLGFADAISPALAELYPDPVERAKAVARHLEFFNCHPYLAAAIL